MSRNNILSWDILYSWISFLYIYFLSNVLEDFRVQTHSCVESNRKYLAQLLRLNILIVVDRESRVRGRYENFVRAESLNLNVEMLRNFMRALNDDKARDK